MKKECSIVRDLLPLYLEKMLSEDTAVFVKEHLEKCPDCAAEFEHLKLGGQTEKTETSQKENDVYVIMAVKKKIAKKIFKIVAAVCLVFIALFSTIMLYTGISYSVTKDNISLNVLADTAKRVWVPNLAVFFKKYVDFEQLRIHIFLSSSE